MGFYEQIAPYYDQIFPAGREQLEFIKDTAGRPPKRLLDVACGAGLYSVALAHEGYEVWATDLDAEMVRQTNARAAAGGVLVKAGILDMLELDKLEADMFETEKTGPDMFNLGKPDSGKYGSDGHESDKGEPSKSPRSGKPGEDKFDCVFCIGNSIVHLGSRDSILSAVLQMKGRLKASGSVVLQIINFNRVISKGITALPSIINPETGLEFHRNYSFDAKTGLIGFDTVLKVRQSGVPERYSNSIKLFPLICSELRAMLERAGFGGIEFFGGFRMEQYVEEESFLLVVRASI